MTEVERSGASTMYCVHEGMSCTTDNANECIDDGIVIADEETWMDANDCQVPIHTDCSCNPTPATVLNVTVFESVTNLAVIGKIPLLSITQEHNND